MPKSKFEKRVARAVRKRIKAQKKKDLLSPQRQLSGKQLNKVAGALTKIELNPSIRAYKQEKKTTRKQLRRDTRALNRLGNKTADQVGRYYNAFDADAQANINALQGIANTSAHGIAGTNRDALMNAVKQVGGTLASTDKSLGENAAGSGSRQKMSEQLALEQQRLIAAGQNDANFSEAMNKAGLIAAMGQRSSAASQGAANQSAIKTTIASRIAQERSAARDAMREAQSKIAETKALRGPTRLKNLMDLRSGERDFWATKAGIKNERLATAIDRAGLNETIRHNKAEESQAAAELAQKSQSDKAQLKLDRKQARWDRKHPSSGSSSSSPGGENPRKISGQEWKTWSAAARNIIRREGLVPKNEKGWNQLADLVGQEEGVDWSPIEQEKFIKRLRKQRG